MWQYDSHQIYRFVPDGGQQYLEGFTQNEPQQAQQQTEQQTEQQAEQQTAEQQQWAEQQYYAQQQYFAEQAALDEEFYGLMPEYDGEYNPMPDFFPEYDTRV
jgi:delta 1-pyrroline-5-carboxylate dehydrogenase